MSTFTSRHINRALKKIGLPKTEDNIGIMYRALANPIYWKEYNPRDKNDVVIIAQLEFGLLTWEEVS